MSLNPGIMLYLATYFFVTPLGTLAFFSYEQRKGEHTLMTGALGLICGLK